jgi:protein gp37
MPNPGANESATPCTSKVSTPKTDGFSRNVARRWLSVDQLAPANTATASRPSSTPFNGADGPVAVSVPSAHGQSHPRSCSAIGETGAMAETSIEWATHVWNPTTGCDRVSPGCAHCYALDLAARLKRMGQSKYQADGRPGSSGPGFAVTLHDQTLTEPLRWRSPRIVFVNSMSDLFHEAIPAEYIARVFEIMVEAKQHTFQVLTKREDRLAELAPDLPWPANVWMGVSIENRRFIHRADRLREVPASVRFISAEPLLGRLEGLNLTGIDWLIAGGESGPKHRPVKERWLTELRDECVGSGVAFFFKQWGGRRSKSGGRLLAGREWSQMPTPLLRELELVAGAC